MSQEAAVSKLEEGVNIMADGGVKIEVKQAAATPDNGLNVVGVSLDAVPDRLVVAITSAEWDRIDEAVASRRTRRPVAP